MTSIDQVDVQSLRGIMSATLSLDGKWLFLFGENGTGKSSFIDALEFFFTGSVTHLQGVQSISPVKHLHHVDEKAGAMSVTVRFSGSARCEVSRNGSGVLSQLPMELKSYFDSASLGTFILRRDQLLKFVCSQPADRYRALDAFIGVENLDDIELNMKRARDEVEGRVSGLEKERSSSLDMLANQLGIPVSSEQEVLARMNDILEKAGASRVSSLDDEGAAVALRIQAKKATLQDDTNKLNVGILTTANALANGPHLDEPIADIVMLQQRHSSARDAEKSRLVDLFTAAKVLLSDGATQVTACPLCGQAVDSHWLLNRIGTYLDENTSWTHEAEKLRTGSSTVNELLGTKSARLDELATLLDKEPEFAEMAGEARKLSRRIQELPHLLVGIEHAGEPVNQRDFIEVEDSLMTLCKEVEVAARNRIESLTLSPEEKSAQELERKLTTVSLYAKQLGKIDSTLVIARARLELADTVYECFKSAKQMVVQGVFERLRDHVSTWFERLHPGDEHTNVRLGIDSGQRASAKLYMDSFGQANQDPRAYSSEGHLDSLGLVIFLAFAKEFQGDCHLLVLDDVVSSIDAQHRQRICSLLVDEFSDWQLIITTHDPIWFEELWNQVISDDLGDKIVREHITKWSRSGGPVLEPCLSRRGKIDKYLADGQLDVAGNQVRNYLEFILKEMCDRTGARIRYRPKANYTLGELFDSLQNRLGEMKDCSFKATLSSCLATLRSLSFMANVLSHDNQTLGTFSLSEVTDYWQMAKEFQDAFVCPRCGKDRLMFDEQLSAVTCAARGCDQGIVAKFKR